MKQSDGKFGGSNQEMFWVAGLKLGEDFYNAASRTPELRASVRLLRISDTERWPGCILEVVKAILARRWPSMSEQDLKKSLEAMKSLSDEMTSSKEKALSFLIEAGMVTKSGELTENYQQGA